MKIILKMNQKQDILEIELPDELIAIFTQRNNLIKERNKIEQERNTILSQGNGPKVGAG